MRPKLLLAAGGTGGHILPAKKIQEALSDSSDVEIAGVNLQEGIAIPGGPLHPKSLPKIAHGIWASEKFLSRFSPDLVIGFGSYHSFPLVFSARRRKIPLWLFEANRVMGRVNGLFAKKSKVFSLLPSSFATPISFLQKPLSKKSNERPTILVMGGSQGAQIFNEKLPSILDEMENIQVIHLTGKNKTAHYHKVPAIVQEYESDMTKAYSEADFVIARSGASTVSELLHYQIPSLLIPLPHAIRDHQTENAAYLEEFGAAKIITEGALSSAIVKEAIEDRAEATFPQHDFPDFIDLIRKELL